MVKVHAQIRGSIKEYHSTEKSEEAMETGRSGSPKPRSKYKPKGINPAYPNKNFVETCYINKSENRDEFYDYMYGPIGSYGFGNRTRPEGDRKASGYGHSIGQRAGKLRLSGHPEAHRIGKRK